MALENHIFADTVGRLTILKVNHYGLKLYYNIRHMYKNLLNLKKKQNSNPAAVQLSCVTIVIATLTILLLKQVYSDNC